MRTCGVSGTSGRTGCEPLGVGPRLAVRRGFAELRNGKVDERLCAIAQALGVEPGLEHTVLNEDEVYTSMTGRQLRAARCVLR